MSVLPCFSQKTVYWLSSTNDTSDLIILVLANEGFFNFVLVYIILPNCKNSTYATLNTVSMFSFLESIRSCFIISWKILFVIGRHVAFCFKKSLFLFLIIKDMWGMLKVSELI